MPAAVDTRFAPCLTPHGRLVLVAQEDAPDLDAALAERLLLAFGRGPDHMSGHTRPYVHTSHVAHVRKITANIPEDILENAQRLTGKGVTLTLVEGLKALDRNARLSALRQLRGKVRFELDLDRTRR